MATISSSQAMPILTKALSAIYSDMVAPKTFLRSFFKERFDATFYLSWQVERFKEKVAKSVPKGSEGNRNRFGNSTEKVVEPPMFREYFDITKLDGYDRIFGSTAIDSGQLALFLNRVREKMQYCVNKMERAYELQAAQVFHDGKIVDAEYGTYDFQRNAESMRNDTGNYWTTGSVSPFAQIKSDCEYLRTVGKSNDVIFDAIFGSLAKEALDTNDTFNSRVSRNSNLLDTLTPPGREANGAAYHGLISAGDYKVRLWTYPEFYDDDNGDAQPYLNTKEYVLLPSNPEFVQNYAMVPQLIDEENPTPQQTKYVFGEFKDKRKAVHDYDVQSCGLMIPVSKDRIVTRQVRA